MTSVTGPSEAAVKAEWQCHVQRALDDMSPIDREIIALRSFEMLSRDQTAQILGIEKSAASKRYIRALKRLKTVIGSLSSNRPQTT